MDPFGLGRRWRARFGATPDPMSAQASMRPRPALLLHIGRNKAGSTSLQNHWMSHSDALQRAGVQVAMFGQPSPPGKTFPTFADHHELADFVRARSDRSVLVSHEGIGCFPADLARVMALDLAGLDMQVIFYLNPYRQWLRSSYAFDVQIGFNRRDFDGYLEHRRPAVSAWPTLEIWGETIGWDKVRVRSLDPRDLHGGDLICDGDAAVGVTLPRPEAAERANRSPSWMTTELLRALIGRDYGDAESGPDLPIEERLGMVVALDYAVNAAIEACGETSNLACYPSRGQSLWLAELYNRDLAAIAARTGVQLQPDDAGAAPERAFLPTADRVPKSVVRFVRKCAADPQTVHPILVAISRMPKFIALCDG